MTVGEMLDRMSSAEFAEWMGYFSLEPFGEMRDDLRAGVIASMVGNVNRAAGSEPFRPADFLMFRDPQELEAQRSDELRDKLLSLKGRSFKARLH